MEERVLGRPQCKRIDVDDNDKMNSSRIMHGPRRDLRSAGDLVNEYCRVIPSMGLIGVQSLFVVPCLHSVNRVQCVDPSSSWS